MRVTLVGSRAGIGGTERHLASLVRGLPPRGFEVELVTSEMGPLSELARGCGVTSTIVPRPGRMAYLAGLTRHLARTRPHVVHAHSGRLPCLAARLAQVRWILDTRHGHLDPGLEPGRDERLQDERLSRERRLRWQLEGWKGRLAHVTLTVCRTDARTLVERGGLPAGRVRTVYNGVRTGGVEASPGRFHSPGLLGWVGRMSEQKAPERVLELLAALVSEPRLNTTTRRLLRIQMVGDGPLRPQLEIEAERLGIEDRVEFLGALPDPLPVIRQFRVLLLPSRREGLPYVLLEGLAAGTPVLATPVGGNGEVLTGDLEPCLLPWSPAGWADVLVALLGSEEQWTRAHDAALVRVEAFSEEEMVDRIAAIYRQGPGG